MKAALWLLLLAPSFFGVGFAPEVFPPPPSSAAERLTHWAQGLQASPEALDFAGAEFVDVLLEVLSADSHGAQRRSADDDDGDDRVADSQDRWLEALAELRKISRATTSVDKTASRVLILTTVGVVAGCLGTAATWLILLFKK
ncbi:hypothetical protein N0V94_007158 [Neodidymelliopsis sp. IMI 364377]|nr:hypothetical protein N0V94_007158 [Neodidymelliopsis sp. IMI 364377]